MSMDGKRTVSKKRDENFGILFLAKSRTDVECCCVECSTDSLKRNLFDLHVVGIHAPALSPASSTVGSLTKCSFAVKVDVRGRKTPSSSLY